jgi:mRNA-degrading endonuclease RelE of RelBE toxin-antitoxin system
MNVRFHSLAEHELREAETYIEAHRTRWGDKFSERADEALRFALSKPGRCVQTYGSLFCSVRVERFPYRIYYEWVGEWRTVYAVHHAGRRERSLVARRTT